MANELWDNFSNSEKKVFKEILSEIGKVKNRGKKPKKIREIVPIRQWIEDEYYVGPAGMSLYPYWKKKMVEVFDERNAVPVNEVIVTGGLGCRPLGSKYQTDKGYLTLDEISKLDDVYILGPEGKLVKIINTHEVGMKDTIKIRFSNGYVMEATVDHRIKVFEKGKIIWKRFDELTRDSRVIYCNRDKPFDGKVGMDSTWDFLILYQASFIYPVEFIKNRCLCGDIEVEGHVYVNEGIIQHNTGKSTFGCFLIVRKLYELSCYENIPALFQLMPGTVISFMYFTISKTQAELTGFGQIKNIIDAIPYFREHFLRNEKLQSMLVFPENLLLFYGSSQNHCLDPESLIYTDRGIVRARNLTKDYKVWNGNSYAKVKNTYRALGEMYSIKTSTGREVIVKDNHLNYTQRGFIETKDLKVGDYFFRSSQLPVPNNEIDKNYLKRCRITGEQLYLGDDEASVPDEILTSDLKCQNEFLDGYIFKDLAFSFQ